MISGSVVVPFQKGPCCEGGRMRGFLLPLLEEASVVVLVLLLIFFEFPPFSHNTKVNRTNFVESKRERKLLLWMDHSGGARGEKLSRVVYSTLFK